MKPHLLRILTEADELKVKILALKDFLQTDKFHALDFQDKSYMDIQLQLMQSYHSVLQVRIVRAR